MVSSYLVPKNKIIQADSEFKGTCIYIFLFTLCPVSKITFYLFVTISLMTKAIEISCPFWIPTADTAEYKLTIILCMCVSLCLVAKQPQHVTLHGVFGAFSVRVCMLVCLLCVGHAPGGTGGAEVSGPSLRQREIGQITPGCVFF